MCSLNTISENIDAFTSSGKDKFVKVWSIRGELLGQFNITTMDTMIWRFPYDWVRIIMKELDEVFDIIEKLDKTEIATRQREAL